MSLAIGFVLGFIFGIILLSLLTCASKDEMPDDSKYWAELKKEVGDGQGTDK